MKLEIMNNYMILILVVFLYTGKIISQSNGINREVYQIHIKKTDNQIKLDGVFDEEPWKEAQLVANFHRVTPTDTGYAIAQTEVMVTPMTKTTYILRLSAMILLLAKDPLSL